MDRQPRSQEQEIENVLSGAAEPAESVDDSRDWEKSSRTSSTVPPRRSSSPATRRSKRSCAPGEKIRTRWRRRCVASCSMPSIASSGRVVRCGSGRVLRRGRRLAVRVCRADSGNAPGS
jgi:hypothetical protein